MPFKGKMFSIFINFTIKIFWRKHKTLQLICQANWRLKLNLIKITMETQMRFLSFANNFMQIEIELSLKFALILPESIIESNCTTDAFWNFQNKNFFKLLFSESFYSIKSVLNTKLKINVLFVCRYSRYSRQIMSEPLIYWSYWQYKLSFDFTKVLVAKVSNLDQS